MIAPLPIEVRAKYTFTEIEKQQLGQDLASRMERRDGLEAEKKSAMSDFKERIDRASMDIRKIQGNINLGYEFRSYTCRIEKNYKLKVKEYYCVHTGRLIDTQKFDAQDFQQTFADEVAVPSKKKKSNGKDIQPSLGQGIDLPSKVKKQKDAEKQANKILKANGQNPKKVDPNK